MLAALCDLAPIGEQICSLPHLLQLSGIELSIQPVTKHGFSGTQLQINLSTDQQLRHLPQIKEVITRAKLPASVQKNAIAVFTTLGEAEAAVHGIALEKVHFHEVGALDTIVDICGVCYALHLLGNPEMLYSTLYVGAGTIAGAHGIMPVPTPAVEKMIQGKTIAPSGLETEILTPTAAALLTTLGKQQLQIPPGRFDGRGWGFGTKEFADRPNAVTVAKISTESYSALPEQPVTIIQTDIDHLSAEVLACVTERLRSVQGVYDITQKAVITKKNRQATQISLICHPNHAGEIANQLMHHTRTLGVRLIEARRIIANRTETQQSIAGTPISFKSCQTGTETFLRHEIEQLEQLAQQKGISLIQLLESVKPGTK